MVILPRDQSFHLQIFCNFKEGLEVGLLKVDLSMVDVVQHSLHIRSLDALEVDQGMAVRILLQNPLEERGAGSQDHLVSLNLIVSAGKSHVSEVLLLLELVEGVADVHLEVIPA